MTVAARISIVTLGVTDLERSKNFYEALGWEPASSSVAGEIVWFRTADTYLGLFGFDALADDAHLPRDRQEGFNGVTFAINLESDDAVIAALDDAVSAGASVLKAPERAIFDGLSAYFADPDGYVWEVAHNPHFPIDKEGRTTIP